MEAQLLEAGGDEAPTDIIDDIEKVTALASAALTYAITADQLLTRVSNVLFREDRTPGRPATEAFNLLQGSTLLATFLPTRFSSNVSRLGGRRPRSGDRE